MDSARWSWIRWKFTYLRRYRDLPDASWNFKFRVFIEKFPHLCFPTRPCPWETCPRNLRVFRRLVVMLQAKQRKNKWSKKLGAQRSGINRTQIYENGARVEKILRTEKQTKKAELPTVTSAGNCVSRLAGKWRKFKRRADEINFSVLIQSLLSRIELYWWLRKHKRFWVDSVSLALVWLLLVELRSLLCTMVSYSHSIIRLQSLSF
jgi:hypothetical protein